MENQELIKLLKKTKKMKNKYLAKRIEQVAENDIQEKERIGKKLYQLLLSLVDEETKKSLKILDATIKILTTRIGEESTWYYSKDYSFFYFDKELLEIFLVKREQEGYVTSSTENPIRLQEENKFLEKYSSILSIIHNALTEKEEILLRLYQVTDNNPLIKELIAYIQNNINIKAELEEKFSYIKRR